MALVYIMMSQEKTPLALVYIMMTQEKRQLALVYIILSQEKNTGISLHHDEPRGKPLYSIMMSRKKL